MAPRAGRKPLRPLVAGNWKMNRGGPEAADFARSVLRELGGRSPGGVEVVLLPPFPAIRSLLPPLKHSEIIRAACWIKARLRGLLRNSMARMPSSTAWRMLFCINGLHSKGWEVFGGRGNCRRGGYVKVIFMLYN